MGVVRSRGGLTVVSLVEGCGGGKLSAVVDRESETGIEEMKCYFCVKSGMVGNLSQLHQLQTLVEHL